MEIVLFVLRIALVVALYAFLGALFWLLWRERAVSTEPTSPVAQLVRLSDDGPGQGSAERAGHDTARRPRYVIRSMAWIGRDPNCLVQAEDEFVSLRHAQVVWRDEDRAWWIEDNLSRNGTFVNDQRVMRAMLRAGDVIRVGHARFRFEADGSKPPA